MIFPFRDHNPSRRFPWVTYSLIAINVAIFLAHLPIMNDGYQLAAFYSDWAMYPAEVSRADELYTVITAMFLHAGWMHLLGNMLFLWIYGDNIEEEFGHISYLLFYLATGVAAAIAHVLIDVNSQIPTIGASGAIAGVMGGYLLLYPKARIDTLLIIIIYFKKITLPASLVLGMWLILQVIGGFMSSAEGGGVAYWAHFGGFIAGAILAVPLWLRLGGIRFWRRSHYHPDHPPTVWGRRKKRRRKGR